MRSTRPWSQARAWRVCWSMGLWSRSPCPPRSRIPPYQSGNETATRMARARARVRSAIEVARPGVPAELLEQALRQAPAVAGGGVGLDARDPPHAGDDRRHRVVAQAEAEGELGQRGRLLSHQPAQPLHALVHLALAIASEVLV